MSSYLLILRRNQDQELGLPVPEMLARFQQFTLALRDGGALRGVERLKPSAEGQTLCARNGSIAVEGPHDPGKEAVIGYFLVEAADAAAAEAIARDCPILLVGGSVEVRETEHFPQQ